LIEEYKSGNNVVVIIDEAQNMPVETLENLRMLSNLETSSDKLIQVVLCGQPEFEQKLNLHELRQLKQRVAIRVRILPLSKNESFEYINHRLARTVTKDPDIFTQGALNKIVREAGGIPRNINILCDNCLVTAFGNQQKKVTTKVAKEIITDHRMEKNSPLKWKIEIVLASIILVTFAIWGYGIYIPNKFPKQSRQVSSKPDPQVVTKKPEVIQSQTVSLVEEKPVSKIMGSKQDGNLEFKPKIIKKGDTLAGLIRDTYGSVDNKLFKLIIKNNPQISNINRIQEGDKLFLPPKH
jgi:general secretion pathway protein A